MDVNDGEKDAEEERTHKGNSGYGLGGALYDVTGCGDEMNESPAHKGRADEKVHLTLGNTKISLEASTKILIQDVN